MDQDPCFLLSRFLQGGKIHRKCQDTLIFPPCSRQLDGGLKNINGLLGTGFPSSAACSLRNETTSTPHFLVPRKSFLLNFKHLFPYLQFLPTATTFRPNFTNFRRSREEPSAAAILQPVPIPQRLMWEWVQQISIWGVVVGCLNAWDRKLLAPVVQRLDNAIHRINRYPVDKC